LRNRFWYKWNRIHIKTLDEQWHDRDEVLVHAMFQILVDFVEQESDSTEDDEACNEIKALYDWWTKVRPARQDPLSNYAGDLSPESLILGNDPKWEAASKEHSAFEDACEKEDEAMMIRLVKIRGYLWS
jgi:hypothetical protein